eukprot:363174_1
MLSTRWCCSKCSRVSRYSKRYDWDYCYDPNRAFVADVNVNGNNLVEWVECQGDCDSDNNCIGAGDLKCYQRVGAAPNPPGCQGTPKTFKMLSTRWCCSKCSRVSRYSKR